MRQLKGFVVKVLELVKNKQLAKLKEIRARSSYFDRPEAEVVRRILKDIQQEKDQALWKYVNKFERPVSSQKDLLVSKEELNQAYLSLAVSEKLLLERAIANIYEFHKKFLLSSWSEKDMTNSKYGVKVTPIERVGVYVPGGTAAYPTSVLMNVIPAQVAGCMEIVLVSPGTATQKMSRYVMATAQMLGITELYAMGGAHAIGALAFGTESIKAVHKISGPGNIYVTLAKKEVFGVVGIDKLAGPSDVCILADSKAEPAYIAADMLAQAEHDVLASAILITDSESLAEKVKSELEVQYQKLPRQEIAKQALENNSAIFLVKNTQEMIELANEVAAEHLEVMHAEEEFIFKELKNAGAIFLGKYSAEVIGDYLLGPNHILPTAGTALFLQL